MRPKGRGKLWGVSKPYAISLTLCAFIVLLLLIVPPVYFIPDWRGYWSAIISFSRGKLTLSEEDVIYIFNLSGPPSPFNLTQDNPKYATRVHQIALTFFWVNTKPFGVPGGPYGFEKAPGFAFILALAHLLRLDYFVNSFIVFLNVLFLYGLVKSLDDERDALYACILLLFNSVFMCMANDRYMADLAGMSFVLYGLGLTVWAVDRQDLRLSLLSGLLLGVSITLRWTNALASLTAFSFPLAHIYVQRRVGRKLMLHFLLLMVGNAGPVALFLLYNQIVFGGPLIFGYQFSEIMVQAPLGLQYFLPSLVSVTPLLLLSFPTLILALLGMARKRVSFEHGMLSIAWMASFVSLYFCYSWILQIWSSGLRSGRLEMGIHVMRFFLPILPGSIIPSVKFLQGLKQKYRILILGAVALLGLSLFAFTYLKALRPLPVATTATA